tara:strand:- start:431 stop:877 length:447 start_codon:yes stop_codon:yes gene_type:complete
MTTIYLNHDELDMMETAIANAKYIFTETEDERKVLKYIKAAALKLPNSDRITKPIKVKLTKKEWSALGDAMTHDRDNIQGPGAWGNPKETDPNSVNYIDKDKDKDCIRAHQLVKIHDEFVNKLKLERMGFIRIEDLNKYKKYQPPADW